jgi:hypothetical protein
VVSGGGGRAGEGGRPGQPGGGLGRREERKEEPAGRRREERHGRAEEGGAARPAGRRKDEPSLQWLKGNLGRRRVCKLWAGPTVQDRRRASDTAWGTSSNHESAYAPRPTDGGSLFLSALNQ